jgi:hypothetical protein
MEIYQAMVHKRLNFKQAHRYMGSKQRADRFDFYLPFALNLCNYVFKKNSSTRCLRFNNN